MSNHLKAELRSPPRSCLPGQYAFDLSRFCPGCWAKLGRVLGRGSSCGRCRRRVCKRCRCLLGSHRWVCVMCVRQKNESRAVWYADANIDTNQKSQGINDPHLLRLADWSSRGLFDIRRSSLKLIKRSKFRRTSEKTQNPNPNTNISDSTTPVPETNPLQGTKCFQFQNEVTEAGTKQYTSSTLKQMRRASRELENMQKYDTLKSHLNLSTKLNQSEYQPNERVVIEEPEKQSNLTLQETPLQLRNKDQERSKRIPLPKRSLAPVFRDGAPFLSHPHARMSVRSTRVFCRKKSYRAYPSPKQDASENYLGLSDFKQRSLSLPTELTHEGLLDFEFWSSGFVQCRVRRLEADLAAVDDDASCVLYHPEFDVQSLCSLEYDRIVPDSEDYRITYLSSAGSSQESNLDFMDDDDLCGSEFGIDAIKQGNRRGLYRNVDWDLFLSAPERTGNGFVGQPPDRGTPPDSDLNENDSQKDKNSARHLDFIEDDNLYDSNFAINADGQENMHTNIALELSSVLDQQGNILFDVDAGKSESANQKMYHTPDKSEVLVFDCNDTDLSSVSEEHNTIAFENNVTTLSTSLGVNSSENDDEKVRTRAQPLPISHDNVIIESSDASAMTGSRDLSSESTNGMGFTSPTMRSYMLEFLQDFLDDQDINGEECLKCCEEFYDENENVVNSIIKYNRNENECYPDKVINSNNDTGNNKNPVDDETNFLDKRKSGKYIKYAPQKMVRDTQLDSSYQNTKNPYSSSFVENKHHHKLTFTNTRDNFLAGQKYSFQDHEINTLPELTTHSSDLENERKIQMWTKFNLQNSERFGVDSRNLSIQQNALDLKSINEQHNIIFMKRKASVCNHNAQLGTIYEYFRLKLEKLSNFSINDIFNCDKQLFSAISDLKFFINDVKYFQTELMDQFHQPNQSDIQEIDMFIEHNDECHFPMLNYNSRNSLVEMNNSFIYEFQNSAKSILDIIQISNKSLDSKTVIDEINNSCGTIFKFLESSVKTINHSQDLMHLALTSWFETASNYLQIKKSITDGIFYPKFQIYAYPCIMHDFYEHFIRNCAVAETNESILIPSPLRGKSNQEKVEGEPFNLVNCFQPCAANWLPNFGAKSFLFDRDESTSATKECQFAPYSVSNPPGINLHSETENVFRVPRAGSVVNGVTESRGSCNTSQTGPATFVECLFQYKAERTRAKARLSYGLELGLTVPAAVERIAERKNCPAQPGESSAFRLRGAPLASGDAARSGDVKFHQSRVDSLWCNDIEVESDYTVNELFSDYPYLDYISCENAPVPEDVKPDIADRDYLCNREAILRSGDFLQNMSNGDDDPRCLSKIGRTTGINISKLKKIFDSKNSDAFVSSNTTVEKCRTPAKNCENKTSDVVQHSASEVKTTDDEFSSKEETEDNLKTCDVLIDAKICENDDANGALPCENNSDEILTESYNVEMINSVLRNEGVNVSESEIFNCENVNGDLWKNVDIGITDNCGLWNPRQQSNFDGESLDCYEEDANENSPFNSLVSSTAELTDLIAASRAELSKKKEPVVDEKSLLENYFATAFENRPIHSDMDSFTDMIENDNYQNSFFNMNASDQMFQNSSYDCDIDEITFEDDDTNLSDASSEDESHVQSTLNNTHYLPAYALHTIIEESCEESELDSHTATPTNEGPTSKLERYFSWDIINDANLGKKDDENSTLYSDSLSEHSGSVNEDVVKEADPTHLASSRLETYFTSGLVGNDNYFYPEDAEYWDDAPVSDFEEDSTHQKISRSALLNSIESKQEPTLTVDSTQDNTFDVSSTHLNLSDSKDLIVSESDPTSVQTNDFNLSEGFGTTEDVVSDSELIDANLKSDAIPELPIFSEDLTTIDDSGDKYDIGEDNQNILNMPLISDASESHSDPEILLCDNIENNESELKPAAKSQLAIDAQAIMKKLILYITDNSSLSLESPMELDYVSAWQILETEIERLMQSVSPSVNLENNSCSSSTIGSNNSDYGSDTIEPVDCITDDDENSIDPRNKISSRCHLVEFLNSAYKSDCETNFNISDETLSIWKRLIQSLQKDTLARSEHKLLDESTEARLYIRDQIIALMHTVTVTETNSPLRCNKKSEIHSKIKKKNLVLDEEPNVLDSDDADLPDSNLTKQDLLNEILVEKTESSDEGISSDSNDNLNAISETPLNNTNLQKKVDFTLNSILPTPRKFADVSHSSTSSDTRTVDRDKVIVDEVDKKRVLNSSLESDTNIKDLQFSVFVDIELGDETSTIKERKLSETSSEVEGTESMESNKRSSLHLWVSDDSVVLEPTIERNHEKSEILVKRTKSMHSGLQKTSQNSPEKITSSKSEIAYRDTGYYSFKSSDDSLLDVASASKDVLAIAESKSNDTFPDFKSLKRSVKKFSVSSSLSKSTNNILQTFSDTKFSTLQMKSHKVKSSHHTGSISRPFTSLFSASSVLKKFSAAKTTGNDSQIPESSIPPKYLKKYARSISVDTESLFGATSMPQLANAKSSDSYSAIGLYTDCDRDSSITPDEEIDPKTFHNYSQSVLSLGSHSASMTSVYSAAGGYHYGYITVSGDVLFGLNYNQKSQMMEVFVKQCRNLAAVDAKKCKSDPYVKVYLLPDKTKGGKRKTKTKKNTINPVFNELLRFPVHKNELESRTLWLSVWNSDLFGRNDFLGEMTLPLGYRLLDSPTLRWYPLQERTESLTSPLKYKGELFLALKYVPRDLSLESRFRPAPVISLRGALHVLVKEARNISGTRSNGTSDAFCKCYLLPDKSKTSKQKTPVVRKSRHPKWYYTVIYEDLSIEELKERSLELTLWDHDKITSNEFMGGVRLNRGIGLYHGVSVDWMDAGRDETSLWQTMLDTPNMWVDGSLPLRPMMQF